LQWVHEERSRDCVAELKLGKKKRKSESKKKEEGKGEKKKECGSFGKGDSMKHRRKSSAPLNKKKGGVMSAEGKFQNQRLAIERDRFLILDKRRKKKVRKAE